MVVFVFLLLFCAIVLGNAYSVKALPAFKKKIPANVDFTPEQNGLLTPERGPFLKKRRGIYYTFDEKKSDVRGDGKKPLQVTQTEEGIPGAMVTFLSRWLKVMMILFCCRWGKREKPANP